MTNNFSYKQHIAKVLFLAALLAAALLARRYFADMSSPDDAQTTGHLDNSRTFNLLEDGHLVSLKIAKNQQPDPLVCYAGLPFVLTVKVANHSGFTLHSGFESVGGVRPVNIGHRFYHDRQENPKEGPRYFFPEPLHPHQSGSDRIVTLPMKCPSQQGHYQLSVELVQEGIAWHVQSKKQATFLNKLKLEVKNLIADTSADQSVHSQKMHQFLRDPKVPLPIKRVSIGAQRLLDISRQVSMATDTRYLLSNAGSQYPMVWVRDLATIQSAFLTYLEVQKNQEIHWSELFFNFQTRQLGVPDWVALGKEVQGVFYDKNTVSSDQELWLVHSIFKAIETGRLSPKWLTLKTNHRSHAKFVEMAIEWLLANRFDRKNTCIFSGHTIDWGDVGPFGKDSTTSTKLEYGGARVCSTYIQSLFLLVSQQIQSFVARFSENRFSPAFLERLAQTDKQVLAFVNKQLWMDQPGYFKIHHHIEESRIACDEEGIFALGAQVLAFEAGLLKSSMLRSVVNTILSKQREYKVSTISGVLFPAYPPGAYENPIIQPYEYQNGGQWDWFGPRAVLMISQDRPQLAKQKLTEIANKVLANETFYEWEHLDGSPGAGPHFRAGAASFLFAAMELFGYGVGESNES